MSEAGTVATIAEFQALDEAEILLGYLEGYEGRASPVIPMSRSFRHGWRNGMVDAGYVDADGAQNALAFEFDRLAKARRSG